LILILGQRFENVDNFNLGSTGDNLSGHEAVTTDKNNRSAFCPKLTDGKHFEKWFLGTNIVGGGKLLINQNVDHSIVNTKTPSNMMSAQPSLLILQRNQLGRRDISQRRGITLPWRIKLSRVLGILMQSSPEETNQEIAS
jgi:hypothetical protein